MLHPVLVQMSALKAVGKPGQEEDVAQVHRIRITLTSRNVKNLEKGAKLLPALLALTLAEAEAFRHDPLRLLSSHLMCRGTSVQCAPTSSGVRRTRA